MSPKVTNMISRWILRYDPVFMVYSALIESVEEDSFHHGVELAEEIMDRGAPWSIALMILRSEKIKKGICGIKDEECCPVDLLEYLKDALAELETKIEKAWVISNN
ncbi:hypothetical protein DYBT9623_00701 [Dyadobacter sp. CECT 9623]|uniref:Uncharacterized protein n=1 Tax=Dyadobacter linearis TaxID=2823330 RepID=A0ABM8UKH4_9BACT|nr:hypothetical protein [Dyadobacter sp. CECT 9623]CAG5067973.1 hypothetical protein DYBT9623_00701 [Dyadobacter sp. CECT 9623]